MKFLTVNDIRFATIDEGSGPVVVLVHGFPLDHTIWDGQIGPLSQRCRVIAPDLRGFGDTEATPGKVSIEQHADDLAAMLDALGVVEPVVLAGLSMGGYIAFRFYQKYRRRLRGMILCDTRAGADTPQAATGRLESARRVEQEGPRVLADMMLPRMLAPATYNSQPEVVERIQQIILAGNAVGLAAAARGLAERPDFSAMLPEIDCPTLLVVGKHDAISTAAEMGVMARSIRGAKLVAIDGAGHMSPLEQPAEVAAAMEAFILGSAEE
jgi:pimeloyl-ACP methyl ester carboxylesterase